MDKTQQKGLSDAERYRKRVTEDDKINQEKTAIRRKHKKLKEEERKLKIEKSLKDHCSGLINWKLKKNSYIWEGFISDKKVFKIQQGVFKYSLSIYPDIILENKKDRNIQTSFELNKLELMAEIIAKKLPKQGEENKKQI